MSAKCRGVCVVAALLLALVPGFASAQAPPAVANPMTGWEARAKAYAAALPEPLADWQAQAREIRVQNSAMAGREVTAYRIYRFGSHPAGLNSITLSISNNPDGSARYPIDFWRTEARRKEKGWTIAPVGGRDAMEGKDGAISTLWFLMPNNLFVALSWQEPFMSREKVLDYVKALDFAKIEALATK